VKPAIYTCITCRYSAAEREGGDGRTGGEMLSALIAEAALMLPQPDSFLLKTTKCFMGCERHCNVHLRAPGKFGYVIGALPPTTESAAAVVDYFARYMESEDGRVPMREWPQALRGHFTARVPPWEDAG